MASTFRKNHFSAKHRVLARVSHLFRNMVYTQNRGLTRGMKRRGGLGFLPEFILPEHSAELDFFRSLELEDSVVFDIGAFEGLTTLWFSKSAKQVVTYEPNPQSHARVQENLQLNNIQNVTLRNVAVGAEPGNIQLSIDPLMPGGATADPELCQQMDGGVEVCSQVTVPVVRVDDDIREQGLPQPDFVKIDIEGFELMALQGLEQTLTDRKPPVYMEMHGADSKAKLANVTAIVEFINQLGYSNVRHIESNQSITLDNAAVASDGHLYCQFA